MYDLIAPIFNKMKPSLIFLLIFFTEFYLNLSKEKD